MNIPIDLYMTNIGFNATQINQIKTGKAKIYGYTWHHHQETGRMQLVNYDTHYKHRHTGGSQLWGSGD